MTLTTALYLTDILENLTNCLTALFLSLFFLFIFCCAAYLICLDEWNDQSNIYKPIYLRIVKKSWVLIPLLILTIPIPSKKTMYLMLGAHYLQETNLPKKVTQALELKLDEYIEELTKEKKSES